MIPSSTAETFISDEDLWDGAGATDRDATSDPFSGPLSATVQPPKQLGLKWIAAYPRNKIDVDDASFHALSSMDAPPFIHWPDPPDHPIQLGPWTARSIRAWTP